jgi:hypothetical protein
VAVAVSRRAELRADARPLRWREIETHGDGELVTKRGRTGTVTLRETSEHDVWAEFQLVVAPRGQRIRCFVFPGAHRRLRTPLQPGQDRRVLARVSHHPDGPELHVLAWR